MKFRYFVSEERSEEANKVADLKEGRGNEDLRCNRYFTVCHRRRQLSVEEDMRLE